MSVVRTFANIILALQIFSGFGSCDFNSDLSLSLREVLGINVNLTVGGKDAVCEAIDAAIPGGKVSYPLSLQYTSSLNNYYSQQESSLQPNCFVRPTSSDDVSRTVKVLAQAYKLNKSKKFAFKSQGHTSFAGAANIANGVTLDLGSLNNITLSGDRSAATIGTGNSWGDVYNYLDTYNLTVTGGRVAGVGVGGLSVGGGISFFSPKQGFACDNIRNFEIVLADGSVVNANSLQYQDLWLALKGGSSNFGIVTAITTNTFYQGALWGGSITYDASTAPQQLAALANFSGLNYDTAASLISTHTFTNPAGLSLNLVVNSMEYDIPTPYPASLKPFTDLPSLSSTMRTDNLYNLAVELGSNTPDGKRQFEMSMTYENDLALLNKTYALFDASKAQIKNATDIVWLLIFEPIPVQMTSKSLPKGGNVLGLENNTTPLMLVLLQAIWTSPLDDDNVVGTMKALYKDVQSAARAVGKLNNFEYLNYADISQDPISTYGPANKAFLQLVSKKYDPQGFWQNAVPGGFKLW